MDNVKPFVLSVYGLIKNNDDGYLFVKRSKESKIFPGKWELPGGKLELYEKLGEGLLREIKEETGLQVLIKDVAGTATFETSKYKVVLLIMNLIADSTNVKTSDEHEDYLWIPLEKAISIDLSVYLFDFLKKYMEA